MNWKTIRLELAASSDFPKGSVGRGFLIKAPIKDCTIDEEAFRLTPERAKVRRVWPNEADEQGRLQRIDGHWALRFDGKPDRLIDLGAEMVTGAQLLMSCNSDVSPFVVRIFD
jgi:hypothetical protein